MHVNVGSPSCQAQKQIYVNAKHYTNIINWKRIDEIANWLKLINVYLYVLHNLFLRNARKVNVFYLTLEHIKQIHTTIKYKEIDEIEYNFEIQKLKM
jgi:phage FluMu protein Com